MVFSAEHSIRAIPLRRDLVYNKEAIVPVMEKGANYVALDVDVREDYIYFSEVNKDVICRIHTNGTGMYICYYICNLCLD